MYGMPIKINTFSKPEQIMRAEFDQFAALVKVAPIVITGRNSVEDLSETSGITRSESRYGFRYNKSSMVSDSSGTTNYLDCESTGER